MKRTALGNTVYLGTTALCWTELDASLGKDVIFQNLWIGTFTVIFNLIESRAETGFTDLDLCCCSCCCFDLRLQHDNTTL